MGKEPTSNAVLEDFPTELQAQAAMALETERASVEKGIDAWKKIVAGAALIQVYTGLVFEGPAIAKYIVAGLKMRLNRAGARTLAEVVGK